MKNNADELAVLSHNIYESYGRNNITGINYFKLYGTDLTHFSNIEVLLYQLNNHQLKLVG